MFVSMSNYNVCCILDLKNQCIKRHGWWRKRAHKEEKNLEDFSHAIYSTLFQNLIFFIYFQSFYLFQLTLNTHWRDWCWSWSSNTLSTWCKEPPHWKRPWCWKDWGQEEKGMTEDGWMASPTQWTWVWANSGRGWRRGKPSML